MPTTIMATSSSGGRRRWVARTALSLVWLASAAVAQDWTLDLRTGLRVEDGGDGDVDLGDRDHGTRTAARLAPRLQWRDRHRAWSADVQLAPAIELPPRRPGSSLSQSAATGRLRYRGGRNHWSLRGSASRVDFEDPSRWRDRRRLSATAGAERFVRPDLSLSASYGVDASWYEGTAGADGAARRDGRHRVRADALWLGGSRWAMTSATALSSGSDLDAYDYRAGQLQGAAGLERGRLRASLQVSREWRRYAGDGTDLWRLTWVGARASWRLSPWLDVYGLAQREHGSAAEERLFTPWSLIEAGLRCRLPLPATTAPARVAPVTASLQPQPASTGWVFRFRAADAGSVHLIGSFTDWDPDAHPMRRGARADAWETTLELPPGIYEYAFLVDGEQWRVPAAPRYVDDGFGNLNGVLVVVTKGNHAP